MSSDEQRAQWEKLTGVSAALWPELQRVLELASDSVTIIRAERMINQLIDEHPQCYFLYLLRIRIGILNLKPPRNNVKAFERRDAQLKVILGDCQTAFDLRPNAEAASLALAVVRIHLHGLMSLIMLDLNWRPGAGNDKLSGSRAVRQAYLNNITAGIANLDRWTGVAESFLRSAAANRRALLESLEPPIVLVMRREAVPQFSYDASLIPYQSDLSTVMDMPSLLGCYVKVNVARLQGLAGAVLSSKGVKEALSKDRDKEREREKGEGRDGSQGCGGGATAAAAAEEGDASSDKALTAAILKFVTSFELHDRYRQVSKAPDDLFGLKIGQSDAMILKRAAEAFAAFALFDLRKTLAKPLKGGSGSELRTSLLLPPSQPIVGPSSAKASSSGEPLKAGAAARTAANDKDRDKEKDKEKDKDSSSSDKPPSAAPAPSPPTESALSLYSALLKPDPLLDRLLDLDEAAPLPPASFSSAAAPSEHTDPATRALAAMRAARAPGCWTWSGDRPSSGCPELDAILPPGHRSDLPPWVHRRLRGSGAPTAVAAKGSDKGLAEMNARIAQVREIWGILTPAEREQLLHVSAAELEDELVAQMSTSSGAADALPRQPGEDLESYQRRVRAEARTLIQSVERDGHVGCSFTCHACGGGSANAFPDAEAFLEHVHAAHLRSPCVLNKAAFTDFDLPDKGWAMLLFQAAETRMLGGPADAKLEKSGLLQLLSDLRKSLKCYRCNTEIVGNCFTSKLFNPDAGLPATNPYVLCIKCYHDARVEAERYPAELAAKLEYLQNDWTLQRLEGRLPLDTQMIGLLREALGWPALASSASAVPAEDVAEAIAEASIVAPPSQAIEPAEGLGKGTSSPRGRRPEDPSTASPPKPAAEDEDDGEAAEADDESEEEEEKEGDADEAEAGPAGHPPPLDAKTEGQQRLFQMASDLGKTMKVVYQTSYTDLNSKHSPAADRSAAVLDELEKFLAEEQAIRAAGQPTSVGALEKALTEVKNVVRHLRGLRSGSGPDSARDLAVLARVIEQYCFLSGLVYALRGQPNGGDADPTITARARAAVARGLLRLPSAVLPRQDPKLQRLAHFLQEAYHGAVREFLGGRLCTPYVEVTGGVVAPHREWLACLQAASPSPSVWEGEEVLRWLCGDALSVPEAAQIAVVRDLLASGGPDASSAAVAARLSTRMCEPLKRFASIEASFDDGVFPGDMRSLCRRGSLACGYSKERPIEDAEARRHYARALAVLGGGAAERLKGIPEVDGPAVLATLRAEGNVLAPVLAADPRLLRLLPVYHLLNVNHKLWTALQEVAQNRIDPVKARIDHNHFASQRIIQNSLTAMSRQVESRWLGNSRALSSVFRSGDILDLQRSSQDSARRQALEPHLDHCYRSFERTRKALREMADSMRGLRDQVGEWITPRANDASAAAPPSAEIPAAWVEEAERILAHPDLLSEAAALEMISAAMRTISTQACRLLAFLLVLSRDAGRPELLLSGYASAVFRRLQDKQQARSLAIAEALLEEAADVGLRTANGGGAAGGGKKKAAKGAGGGKGVGGGARGPPAAVAPQGASTAPEPSGPAATNGAPGPTENGHPGPFKPPRRSSGGGGAPSLAPEPAANGSSVGEQPAAASHSVLPGGTLLDEVNVLLPFAPTPAFPTDPGVTVIAEDCMWLCWCGAINKGYGGARRCDRCGSGLAPCKRYVIGAGCGAAACEYVHARFEQMPAFSREARRLMGGKGLSVLRTTVLQLGRLKELTTMRKGAGVGGSDKASTTR